MVRSPEQLFSQVALSRENVDESLLNLNQKLETLEQRFGKQNQALEQLTSRIEGGQGQGQGQGVDAESDEKRARDDEARAKMVEDFRHEQQLMREIKDACVQGEKDRQEAEELRVKDWERFRIVEDMRVLGESEREAAERVRQKAVADIATQVGVPVSVSVSVFICACVCVSACQETEGCVGVCVVCGVN